MRIHRDTLRIRVLGTLAGAGFLAIGVYAMFGADDTIALQVRNRAFRFGTCALIAGVWAIAVSWLDPDLSDVWCRPARAPREPGLPKE